MFYVHTYLSLGEWSQFASCLARGGSTTTNKQSWPWTNGEPVNHYGTIYKVSIYIYIIIYYISITSSTAQGGGGSFKKRKPMGEVSCCESGMAERSHWWTERCLRSPFFLSLSLFFSLFLYLSLIIYLPTYWSICLPIYLSIYLSGCLVF